MGEGVILYQSKYGATKKYAEWLLEKTGYDCFDTQKCKIERMEAYKTIILGGGVYASGIAGLSFLKKNIERLGDKKIAVFCVGASPYDENAIDQVRKLHFKDKLANVPLYYCRGAWDLEAMTFTDRTLCKLLQKSVAKKDPDTYEPWQRALMSAGTQKCDWTEEKYLKPLLEFLNVGKESI